ncbi:MAG: chorismate mutase [Candidatus Bipolaricaulota bacterium]|nr:chorismate mutase [Candidatus Bipolaricaulota bacterium]MBS3791619.1 chorismate mutase [Candidatus Bipolaricaulota bacterium]
MIDDLRAKIDEIDEKLVELMNRRASTALEIGQYKEKRSWRITDEEREEAVLNRVKGLNDGPFSDEQMERIYGQLISETKEIQKEIKVEVDADDSSDEAGRN